MSEEETSAGGKNWDGSEPLEVLLPRQFESFLGLQRKDWKLKIKREKSARDVHQVFIRLFFPATWKPSDCRPLFRLGVI